MKLKRVLSCLLLAGLAGALSACGESPQTPVSVQTGQTGPVLTLSVAAADGRELLLRDGALFRLYKQERLLQTVTLKDNQVQLAAVTEAPPYRYQLDNVVSEGFVADRGVPIDTQGGLRTPDRLPASPLPAVLTPVLTPSASSAAAVNLIGTIDSDLRAGAPRTLRLSWPGS